MKINLLWAILCVVMAGCVTSPKDPTTPIVPSGERIERLVAIWRPLISRAIVRAIDADPKKREKIAAALGVSAAITCEMAASGQFDPDILSQRITAKVIPMIDSDTGLAVCASILTLYDSFSVESGTEGNIQERMLPAMKALCGLLTELETAIKRGGLQAMPRLK